MTAPTDTTDGPDPTGQDPQTTDQNTTATDPDHADTTQNKDDDQGGGKGGNAEAAKYRRQLRDTEADRDGLRERLTGYERREAERVAANTLADGADLWAAGTTLDDLRSDDGTLDEAKIAAAAQSITADRPHWAKPRTPRPDRRHGGTQAPEKAARTSWADALGKRH